MLIIMVNLTQEEYLSPALQTNSKQYKINTTFLTGCNGFFSVTNKTLQPIVQNQLTMTLSVKLLSFPEPTN